MKRKLLKWLFVAIAVSLPCLNVLSDTLIIRVTTDGTGDGSSWASPANLDAAVTIAKTAAKAGNLDNQIWLKKGTYNRTTIVMHDSLYIYGGFNGDETTLINRNFGLNKTIIDGGDVTPIFRSWFAGTRTSSVIPSLLDGLILQNGYSSDQNGGAVLISNGAKISNCIFRNNRTEPTSLKHGGALMCYGGSYIVENCLFHNNTSAGNGGAIQVGGNVNKVTLVNCTFANNSSSTSYVGNAFGGAGTTSSYKFQNVLAYNNYNITSGFTSFGMNTGGADGGSGTISSTNCAIESASGKFTETNDTAFILLTRALSPFKSACTVYGKGTTSDELNAIASANFELATGSSCIDAGNSNRLSTSTTKDLNFTNRIQGTSVDIGAFEFDPSKTAISTQNKPFAFRAFVANSELQIIGAQAGEKVKLYNSKGQLVLSSYVNSDNRPTKIQLNQHGLYIVVSGNSSAKILYQ